MKNNFTNLLLSLIAIMLFIFPDLQAQKLKFNYDAAGNQVKRWICYNPTQCGETQDPNGNPYLKQKEEEKETVDVATVDVENKITVYPNPTTGLVKVAWEEEINSMIEKIELVGTSELFYKEINVTKEDNAIEMDISEEFTGMYVFIITLSDGTEIHKKVLKK